MMVTMMEVLTKLKIIKKKGCFLAVNDLEVHAFLGAYNLKK